MLYYVSPLILGYFGPTSTMLHGHIALAILFPPETDFQIFGALGLTLRRFTWANHSERWILVSNVSMTCNSFREFHTLDWFLHV